MLELYYITDSVLRRQRRQLLIYRPVVLTQAKYLQIYLRRTSQLASKISITNGKQTRRSYLVGFPPYKHYLRLLTNTEATILN